MATIKSFTSVEQSRKLAEILPLESADMWWSKCTITDFGDGVLKVSYAVEPCNISQFRNTKEDIPCWSLVALLAFLPNSAFLERGNVTELYRITLPIELVPFDWFVEPVDACVAMIEKLHELNLL